MLIIPVDILEISVGNEGSSSVSMVITGSIAVFSRYCLGKLLGLFVLPVDFQHVPRQFYFLKIYSWSCPNALFLFFPLYLHACLVLLHSFCADTICVTLLFNYVLKTISTLIKELRKTVAQIT